MTRFLSLPRVYVAMAVAMWWLLVGAGCSTDKEVAQQAAKGERARSATPVIVAPVRYEAERTRVEAVGTSRALKSVTVHTPVAGEVVVVNFEPGQHVGKGDVLVQLDAREQKLDVELAQVRLAEAERIYQRFRRSETSGAVTEAQLSDARAAMEAARVELNRARVALEDHSVEAPFAGFVGITDVEPGTWVDPASPIVTLDDRSALLVSFEVPENFVGQLNAGDTVAVVSWSGRGDAVTGRIEHVGSRIDPVSRTFVVRARVDNRDDRLRPGMSFRVRTDIEGSEFAVVPEVSVQWGADGSYVWAVRDQRATQVPVTIVQRRQGVVLVDADLASGTPVVVEGVQRMRQGRQVSYASATAAQDVAVSDAVATP